MTIGTRDLHPPETVQITDREFQAIRALVYQHFGINLTEQKRTLVVGRLRKVLRQRGFATFADYYEWVTSDTSGDALSELATRISTNHTYFFRENDHFKFFAHTLVPEAVARHRQAGDNHLRIWCAGCSSGEEPYTLMMLMMAVLGPRFSDWKVRLLATDISVEALKNAMAGTYEAQSVEALPKQLQQEYFRTIPDGKLAVTDEVRRNIIFRRHNLMDAAFPFKNQFDAIFCRNVMIYFDQETRATLVQKYFQHTIAGGYLIIGHSETLNRTATQYEYVRPAVYRKPA